MAAARRPDDPSPRGDFTRELLDDAFVIQKGLWQTIVALLIRPRRVVEAYGKDAGTAYYSPVKWVLLTTAVLTFVLYAAVDFDRILDDQIQSSLTSPQTQLDEEDHAQAREIADAAAMIYKKLNRDFSALSTLFLLLPAISLFSFLLYRRRIAGFSRHMAFNAYFIGEINVLQLVLVIPMFFMSTESLQESGYMISLDVVGITYLLYAYLRLFATRRVGSWLVALLAPLLGAGLYTAVTVVIAVGVGLFLTMI
jgi:hypothetical protein